MSKMTAGECDNLLLAYLSAKCPVYFAPAMDLDMYKHPTTINNIKKLQSFGNILIPSAFGELASGLIGEGRMAEPVEIIEHIVADLSKDLPLSNKKILVTAGPTYEAIDPIRFIGNRSSGKMGVAIAKECARNGAQVKLILGPSNIDVKETNINIARVESAKEMMVLSKEILMILIYQFLLQLFLIMHQSILKKIRLRKKTRILSYHFVLQQIYYLRWVKKKCWSFLVGFALESENELENAKDKLKEKP